MKKRGKAIREPITGRVIAYEKSKTVGIRNPLTGRIHTRVKRTKNSSRLQYG
jgi:hypothetical protein